MTLSVQYSLATCGAATPTREARRSACQQGLPCRHQQAYILPPSADQRSAAAGVRRHTAAVHCRAALPDTAQAAELDTQAALARLAERRGRMQAAIPAGPRDDPPSYDAIDAQPHNRLFMHMFRQSVVEGLGEDAPEPGFDGIITLTRRLSSKFADPRDAHELVVNVLRSLFPLWLMPAFRAMFARPLPEFSNRMVAFATQLTSQWLMGPSEVATEERPDGTVVSGTTVKVERCRVLEQSGCASVCVNCCKIPTQEFFKQEMGLDLRMTPNYEDFSCQFDFGVKPLPPEEDEALASPCFMQCPAKMRHRLEAEPLCGGLGQ